MVDRHLEENISDVMTMVYRFVDRVLEMIWPDKLVTSKFLSALFDRLFERYQQAIEACSLSTRR